jgi:hypothetical protein
MTDEPEWTPEQVREIQRIASDLFERSERLRVAIRLGEKALLRLRAECLLERADGGRRRAG